MNYKDYIQETIIEAVSSVSDEKILKEIYTFIMAIIADQKGTHPEDF